MNRHILVLKFVVTVFFLTTFCLRVCGQVNTGGDYEILTPKPALRPRLNSPLVYGARPEHPFIFHIPCQGNRPIHFTIKNLPSTLKLDKTTGLVTGTVPAKGNYNMVIMAKNKNGKDSKNFKLVAGDTLSLTPSMG